MGSLFARKLAEEGLPVVAVDLAAAPAGTLMVREYLSADVTAPTDQAQRAVAGAGCVLACLHESVMLRAVDAILPAMQPGALLVDTLSVKTPYVELVGCARPDVEILSIDPLFAPSVGFAGQNVVAVEVRGAARVQAFIASIERWGASVTRMSAEDHDRSAAAIQVATHAAVIAFGMCLSRLRYDINMASAVTTPPHRTLLALLARIMTANPDVYWEIQTMNPFARSARAALTEALAELVRIVDDGDRSAFHALFARGLDAIGPAAPPYARYCAELFAVDAPRLTGFGEAHAPAVPTRGGP